jgi:hypothetical protein
MANYIVVYTISDDQNRAQFANELEDLGLNETVDQSTKFGFYNATKDALILKLRTLRINCNLVKSDTVFLFYGTEEPFNNCTIKKEVI